MNADEKFEQTILLGKSTYMSRQTPSPEAPGAAGPGTAGPYL